MRYWGWMLDGYSLFLDQCIIFAKRPLSLSVFSLFRFRTCTEHFECQSYAGIVLTVIQHVSPTAAPEAVFTRHPIEQLALHIQTVRYVHVYMTGVLPYLVISRSLQLFTCQVLDCVEIGILVSAKFYSIVDRQPWHSVRLAFSSCLGPVCNTLPYAVKICC